MGEGREEEGREGKGREGEKQTHDNKHDGMVDVQKRVFIWMHYYCICCTCVHHSVREKI